MTKAEKYVAGAARPAEIQKDGDKWTLILVRELKHAPEKVWAALTEPGQLKEWAPYEPGGSLSKVGPVTLAWIGTPQVTEAKVTRAEAPKLLEVSDMRWELEPMGAGGTRLKLWHSIDRRYISMGAAGWHISFDVLERMLAGTPMARSEAMKTDWQRLNGEYAQQFGIETPKF